MTILNYCLLHHITPCHQTYHQTNISEHSTLQALCNQVSSLVAASIKAPMHAASIWSTSTYLHHQVPTDSSRQLRGPCGAWHCKASVWDGGGHGMVTHTETTGEPVAHETTETARVGKFGRKFGSIRKYSHTFFEVWIENTIIFNL